MRANRTVGADVAHEVADHHGGHDGQPAHGRGARLGAVAGRAVLADVLADAAADQPAHEHGVTRMASHEGDAARLHQ